MYVKYRGPCCWPHVREVRSFAIRGQECEEVDGVIIAGAELYDAGYETVAEVLDTFAEYLASLMVEDVRQVESMREPQHNPIESVFGTYGNDYTDEATLRWFNSHDAAEKVLNDICEALSAGKQFFDLTAYGEDGMVRA